MPDAPTQNRPLAGKSVLVVEDETLVSLDMARMLESSGARVVGPAASVTEALFAIEENAPDAALLDINLQGEMILPVADLLSHRKVPFAFATGYDRELVLPERLRGRPTIRKPFSEIEILDAVSDLLRAEAAAA